MSVIILLGTIFAETFTAIIGLMAGILLFRAYMRRKKVFLLFFSVTFFLLSLMILALFVSQIVGAFFGQQLAKEILRMHEILLAGAGMVMLFGITSLYLRGGTQKIVFGAIAGVFVSIFGFTVYRQIGVTHIQGIGFSDLVIQDVFPMFSGLTFAFLFLFCASLIKTARLRLKKEAAHKPNKYLLLAASLGLFVAVLAWLFGALQIDVIVPVSFIVLALFEVMLFIGVMSWDHPDRRVVVKPSLVYYRSLLLKTSGLNIILFGALAFLLVGFTAMHFMGAVTEAKFDAMEASLSLRQQKYMNDTETLLTTAEHLALTPSIVTLLSRSESLGIDLLDDFLKTVGQNLIVRIIAIDGTVLFNSETDASEEEFIKTQTFLSAITGKSLAMLEEEQVPYEFDTLRSAAPVYADNGSIVGVVMVTNLVPPLSDFSVFNLPSLVVGHGFISDDDRIVYESGEPLDVLTRYDFEKSLNGVEAIKNGQAGELLYYTRRMRKTDGSSAGFVYIYTTETVVATETARVLLTVGVLALLTTLMMLIILVYFTSRALRPIVKLAKAAEQLERGNFDIQVDYSGPDELGSLADTFNHMTETIGEQTIHLKEALHEQKDFLMHTAQEMRNPLNHFRWTLEMFRFGEVGTLNQEQLEMVDQLSKTSDRLQRMVQNITDANKLTDGKMKPKLEVAALEDIVDDVAGTIVVAVRRKNINLHWKYPRSPLPKVKIDTKMLHRVLTNLMSNAVKYTDKDGHIEVTVKEVDERKPGGKKGAYLYVSIEDNGIGIAEDEQSRVFTLFFRSTDVVEKDIEGAGLGLFIAKKLVELNRGAMWFESQQGKGSTFYFTIPLAESDPEKQ